MIYLYCIRKEPAAIYNPASCKCRPAGIVSEKSLPQSTIARTAGAVGVALYQKRACRNLQSFSGLALRPLHCIRKEPAAIYNPAQSSPAKFYIVSEKSLPQSTIRQTKAGSPSQLYQKRACRNLQCYHTYDSRRSDCIRKEPAAIYNEPLTPSRR